MASYVCGGGGGGEVCGWGWGGGLSCEESFTLMIPGGVDEEEGLLRGYMEERRAD